MPMTNGNRKLGKGIFGYNLPLSSCAKYATPQCKKYCYTLRSGFQFKSAKTYLANNLTESSQDDFVKRMVSQIVLERMPYVRLHSSGDFHSTEYFEKWCRIAEMSPNTKFLAFTRNYDIDFNKAPSNLVIYYSVDESTTKINPTAKLFSHVVEPIKDTKHMQRHAKGFVCHSKCHECRACWSGKINIVFPRH